MSVHLTERKKHKFNSLGYHSVTNTKEKYFKKINLGNLRYPNMICIYYDIQKVSKLQLITWKSLQFCSPYMDTNDNG